jgi:hypothetical protein
VGINNVLEMFLNNDDPYAHFVYKYTQIYAILREVRVLPVLTRGLNADDKPKKKKKSSPPVIYILT